MSWLATRFYKQLGRQVSSGRPGARNVRAGGGNKRLMTPGKGFTTLGEAPLCRDIRSTR
jgi:hypothetical protein